VKTYDGASPTGKAQTKEGSQAKEVIVTTTTTRTVDRKSLEESGTNSAKLSSRNRMFTAFTFFSMFFGAGNLIFPPLMGAQAQSATLPATIGFIVSAVGLPVLGVLAVASAGGFEQLVSRVSPGFASVLAFIIIMSIGPCFAIPRTATTSYEMALTPFVGADNQLALFLYSLVFFVLAFILSLHPEKLSKSLGHITGPLLIALIAVMFITCLFVPHAPFGTPNADYAHGALVKGFINGYQTMDLLASLYFGIVISANIKQFGITERKANQHEVDIAGTGAGVLLVLVYAVLSFIGVISGTLKSANGSHDTGATVLTNLTTSVFGTAGTTFVGLIFIVACFNVCTGVLSTCASYFEEHFPTVAGHAIGYKQWSAIVAIFSFIVSNAGLSTIITVSLPVLGALYPIAIVLVLLYMVEQPFSSKFPRVYLWSVVMVAAFTIFDCLMKLLAVFGIKLTTVSGFLASLPLYNEQLTWLIPAAAGILIGVVDSMVRGGNKVSAVQTR
jgi:branched-chain amino acid:cation transporter, LIVCS family